MDHDQLGRERAAGRVFIGYEEGSIAFPPTYKFDNGTDAYDSSEKRRVPSWTDRILFKPARNPSAIELLQYVSVNDLRTSDHRAVTASFRVTLRTSHHRNSSSAMSSAARVDVHGLLSPLGGRRAQDSDASPIAASDVPVVQKKADIAPHSTASPTRPPRGAGTSRVVPIGSPDFVAAEVADRQSCTRCTVM